MHFNPRSREGSDVDLLAVVGHVAAISIHAPAKGATASFATSLASSMISIHAPAKGATLIREVNVPNTKFQSTLP